MFIVGKLKPEHLLAGRQPFRMSREDVRVFLPKFKIEHTVPLNDVLKTLNMNDMFIEVGYCPFISMKL